MAPDGKYLYLAGMLSSGLSTLIWLGFINIFFRSQLLFQVPGWAGTSVIFVSHSSILNLFRHTFGSVWPSSVASSCSTPS